MSVPVPPIRPRLLMLALTTALLTGCATVGPDWHGAPNAAPVAAARPAFLRASADTTAEAPTARWWESLGDPTLNEVETAALAGSPDLVAAQARIDSARAVLDTANGALRPAASIDAVAGELSLPGSLIGRSGRLSEPIYADNFQASWEIDLFGAGRRRVEGARDRAAAAQAAAADVAVSLSAEVARVYVALRAQQAVAALLERQVDSDQRLVNFAQTRFAGGTGNDQAVEAARATLAQSQSDLIDTRAQVTVLSDQLAVLAGREPGAFDALVAKPGVLPQAPAVVAVGDPARLLRHRPDIRQAEQQLAAANADLGARIADRFPKISFTGLLGLGGANPGEAFNPSSLIALLVPQIKWNLFDGGRAAAQVRGARSARAEAEANYRSRVLSALEDAEGALTRFGAARNAFAKSAQARDSIVHVASLQALRADGGTASRADALSADRQALRAQIATATAQAQLTTNFIAVEKALGLGWEPGTAQK